MEPFHDKLKASKDNIYDKEVAVKFFNHSFETNAKISPKAYKAFFDKHEEDKRSKEVDLLKQVEELKNQLK